jgi:hypothetical protein
MEIGDSLYLGSLSGLPVTRKGGVIEPAYEVQLDWSA